MRLKQNVVSTTPSNSRAEEIDHLLKAVQDQLIPFIRSADNELEWHQKRKHEIVSRSCVVDARPFKSLSSLLNSALDLPTEAQGGPGLLGTLELILKYSVNTFAPGFLDKLYASTNAPGITTDLILSVLNTNLHVYQVSPVLTLVEKNTTKALAALFGLTGPRAGGISVQGGSASNTTSIVLARNTLYPQTKIHGNYHEGRQLVLFTSAHGHYSIEKAAQICGFGSAAVVSVPVDLTGAMIPEELEKLIVLAEAAGKTPFYINATAGTTVLGSFDPFPAIAAVAKRHNIWFHIDGAWGGSFSFSEKLKYKLDGSHLADSIATNPHKMLGVPITCSFLLVKDLRELQRANTLPAGYLFHGCDGDIEEGVGEATMHADSSRITRSEDDEWTEPNDLADLTLQCGRRGDSLKLFLSWQYYGKDGYTQKIDNAYAVAGYLATMLADNPDIVLVSQSPPPCLQVCFYYAPGSRFVFGDGPGQVRPVNLPHNNGSDERERAVALALGRHNSSVTEKIARALVPRGFMIDFAPALEGQEAAGKFFRVVINIETCRETVERMVLELMDAGRQVVQDLQELHGSDSLVSEAVIY